jgi:hypothetical protein
MRGFLNHRATATFLPAILGLGGAWFSIEEYEQYGWSLFLGLPVLVAFLASFCWSFKRHPSFASAYGVALMSILTLGGLILIFALDGLICLLMALPLSSILALVGAGLGRWVGGELATGRASTTASLLCLLFPLLVGFEHTNPSEAVVREVTTAVWIDAPIGEVWKAVIAFPRIAETPRGVFQLGIAYPVEARIEGQGVGAIRYCTFSTGDFVEPIVEWEENARLTFDVTENPPPMKEITIYDDVHAPHLHGYMVSKRGQFRLSERDGRVLLEGTTWYCHTISPEFYWGMISDEIIHRIHKRVLNHIKRHTETVQRF